MIKAQCGLLCAFLQLSYNIIADFPGEPIEA